MKIVCIGDSLTFGYGVNQNHRWSTILEELLQIPIINKGVNGDTTTGMLSRSFQDVLSLHPSHSILMGGTNDFIGGTSPGRVISNIQSMVEELKQHHILPILAVQPPIISPLARIFWSSTTDFEEVNSSIRTYREWLLTYAKDHNIGCIDFYGTFEKVLSIGKEENYYVDGLHPTVKGHALMAHHVVESLKEGKFFEKA